MRNLKGMEWAAHKLGQYRAVLTLTVWLSNMWAFMAGHGRFKVGVCVHARSDRGAVSIGHPNHHHKLINQQALRWLDAPFVLWLQRPKNLAHQFVTHGFGQARMN